MKVIEISLEYGNVLGYVTQINDDLFLNYLDDHLDSENKDNFLNFLFLEFGNKNFSLLKHISVNIDFRLKGVGKNLFSNFIDQSSGPIILICDNLESQNLGFNLEQWYKRLGFKETGFKTISGPILIRY